MKPCCESVAARYVEVVTALKGGPQEGAALYCGECQLGILYHDGRFQNPKREASS